MVVKRQSAAARKKVAPRWRCLQLPCRVQFQGRWVSRKRLPDEVYHTSLPPRQLDLSMDGHRPCPAHRHSLLTRQGVGVLHCWRLRRSRDRHVYSGSWKAGLERRTAAIPPEDATKTTYFQLLMGSLRGTGLRVHFSLVRMGIQRYLEIWDPLSPPPDTPPSFCRCAPALTAILHSASPSSPSPSS